MPVDAAQRVREVIATLQKENKTQDEIGKLLKVHQTMVGMILNGKRQPGREVIEAAVRHVGVPPDFFYDTKYVGSFRDYPRSTTLDTSTADDIPTTYSEDVQWAAEQAGLTEDETGRLGNVQRSIGRMTRSELLSSAESIVRNREGKATLPFAPKTSPGGEPTKVDTSRGMMLKPTKKKKR